MLRGAGQKQHPSVHAAPSGAGRGTRSVSQGPYLRRRQAVLERRTGIAKVAGFCGWALAGGTAFFAIWELGGSASDALLRRFLHDGGRLQLVAHDGRRMERDAPRLLRLLKDYGHLIEARRTSQSLRQLTDSFCIADQRDIVRRFHADHFRGEAVFDSPEDTQTSLERFLTIWTESGPGLYANSTGL